MCDNHVGKSPFTARVGLAIGCPHSTNKGVLPREGPIRGGAARRCDSVRARTQVRTFAGRTRPLKAAAVRARASQRLLATLRKW